MGVIPPPPPSKLDLFVLQRPLISIWYVFPPLYPTQHDKLTTVRSTRTRDKSLSSNIPSSYQVPCHSIYLIPWLNPLELKVNIIRVPCWNGTVFDFLDAFLVSHFALFITTWSHTPHSNCWLYDQIIIYWCHHSDEFSRHRWSVYYSHHPVCSTFSFFSLLFTESHPLHLWAITGHHIRYHPK